ncbi:HAD family hydrolase [Erwinia psidii]|uniref:phosphoglycolate phosphatase n=1 Tax=Erwinia psidii TaxID=69224 RepID=A0A3N6SAG3_9GAMM|nr:HAD family hydrolase [Erwinia psidii]MCX8957293.1 HAD family hydrolase [Erwinia psidii]MCX8959664.1 HAD family hydrolase [Erwinia psidii]MCX8964608.1 HAD family hydrolase [Erwinia psidii]RQM38280.1 HAD family hydrolase [Erwinia psidii]
MKDNQAIVMFDLDGTLFDTAQAIPLTFNAAFRALGLPAFSADEIRVTIGLPLEKAFSDLMNLAVDHPQVICAVNEYQRQFKTIILPAAKDLLFPGVATGLEHLHSSGFRLSVTTNKFSHSANTLLSAAGIAHFFDIVVGADEVASKKPHPESGQKILDFFQADKSQAIMVGDTTHDILMANNLGSASIAVSYGIHDKNTLIAARPGILVDSFDDVVKQCHEMTARAVAGESSVNITR